MQILIADGLADNAILHELYTHLTQALDLHIDNAIRQTELRDTIFQYTTNLMQRLINGHLIPLLRHITCERETCRS